jgi:hypothetical protein
MANAGGKTKKAVKGSRDRTVLYLYGISRATQSGRVQTAGVDGSSVVEPVPCAGFTCWVSSVDGREFGEELQEHMEDLEWLANASVRHQRVVARLAEEREVLPARFGIVFRNAASLIEDVRRKQSILKKQLAHIQDAEEWGIKVYRRAQTASVVAESGSDYLRQKAKLLQRSSSSQLDATVVALARELQKIARDSAPAGTVSSGQANLEWQASFLVPRRKRKQWDKVLQRYAADWHGKREIEVTGPWPPYSFVS